MQMIDGKMVSPRRFVFASVLALVLCAVCVGGVSGAADISWYDADKDTFTITTAEQLAGLASLVKAGNTFSEKTVLLGSDIDLKNIDWTPIGTSDYPFAGTFNGGGNTIDNLHLTGHAVLGLFGYVSGTVQNVNINTCEIDPPNSGCTLGSLVGIIKGGVVKDSAVTGLVVANIGNQGGDGSKYTFGGLVGQVLDSGGNEVTDGDDVAQYIQGVCYVVSAKALNKGGSVANNVKFGLICGGPSVGTVSGESRLSTCIITVVTTDSGVSTEKTETRNYEPGLHTVHTIPDGYFLTEMTQSPEGVFTNTDGSISGTLEVDTVYTLTIYQTKITYTVTIPETFEIKDDADTPGVGTGTAFIYASNVALPADSCIILKVSSEQFSDDSFNLKHVLSSTFTLPYTLSVEGKVLKNGDVFAKFTEYDDVPLTASVNSRPQLAGEYRDILTVTVEEVKDTA